MKKKGDFNLQNYLLRFHLLRIKNSKLQKSRAVTESVDDLCGHIMESFSWTRLNPTDIMQWADILLYAFEGAWRSGLDIPEITGRIGEPGSFDSSKPLNLDLLLPLCKKGVESAWMDLINITLRIMENLGWPRAAIYNIMLARQIKNEAHNKQSKSG